jgi:very-short-patch-repair endonuclease
VANESAKHLRRNMTGPERTLWRELRLLRKTGFVFRRQSPFGIYVVDFISHRERLVIEVDGVTHEPEKQKLHDAERTKFIETRGYDLVRYTNAEVLDATTIVNRIKQMLVERRAAKFTAMPPHLRAEFPPPEPFRPSASNVRPPRSGGGIP